LLKSPSHASQESAVIKLNRDTLYLAATAVLLALTMLPGFA